MQLHTTKLVSSLSTVCSFPTNRPPAVTFAQHCRMSHRSDEDGSDGTFQHIGNDDSMHSSEEEDDSLRSSPSRVEVDSSPIPDQFNNHHSFIFPGSHSYDDVQPRESAGNRLDASLDRLLDQSLSRANPLPSQTSRDRPLVDTYGPIPDETATYQPGSEQVGGGYGFRRKISCTPQAPPFMHESARSRLHLDTAVDSPDSRLGDSDTLETPSRPPRRQNTSEVSDNGWDAEALLQFAVDAAVTLTPSGSPEASMLVDDPDNPFTSKTSRPSTPVNSHHPSHVQSSAHPVAPPTTNQDLALQAFFIFGGFDNGPADGPPPGIVLPHPSGQVLNAEPAIAKNRMSSSEIPAPTTKKDLKRPPIPSSSSTEVTALPLSRPSINIKPLVYPSSHPSSHKLPTSENKNAPPPPARERATQRSSNPRSSTPVTAQPSSVASGSGGAHLAPPSAFPTAVSPIREDEEMQSLPPSTPLPQGKQGRTSNETKEKLENAFRRINDIIFETTRATGFNAEQVTDQYLTFANIPSEKTDWNIYQAYFAKNMSQQRDLAIEYNNQQPQERMYSEPPDEWKAKHCYPAFLHQQGDKAREFLHKWSELNEVEASSTETLQARKRRFNNWVEPIARALHQGGLHDFQGILLAVGSLPNSDQGLIRCVVGNRMPRLLTDTFNRSESDILALVQATAYHQVVKDNQVDLPPLPGPPDATVNVPDGTLLPAIRKYFREAFELAGKPFPGNTRMPWATLAGHCATHGIYITGWPCNVRFPSQTNDGKGEQGIKALSTKEQQEMLKAMNHLDPSQKLRLVFGDAKALQESNEPVIICAAPPPSSEFARAPRIFLNKKIDQRGPARLTKGKERVVADAQPLLQSHEPSRSQPSKPHTPLPKHPRKPKAPSRSLSYDSDTDDDVPQRGQKPRRRRLTTKGRTIKSSDDEESLLQEPPTRKRVRNDESIGEGGVVSSTMSTISQQTGSLAPQPAVQPPRKRSRSSTPLTPGDSRQSSISPPRVGRSTTAPKPQPRPRPITASKTSSTSTSARDLPTAEHVNVPRPQSAQPPQAKPADSGVFADVTSRPSRVERSTSVAASVNVPTDLNTNTRVAGGGVCQPTTTTPVVGLDLSRFPPDVARELTNLSPEMAAQLASLPSSAVVEGLKNYKKFLQQQKHVKGNNKMSRPPGHVTSAATERGGGNIHNAPSQDHSSKAGVANSSDSGAKKHVRKESKATNIAEPGLKDRNREGFTEPSNNLGTTVHVETGPSSGTFATGPSRPSSSTFASGPSCPDLAAFGPDVATRLADFPESAIQQGFAAFQQVYNSSGPLKKAAAASTQSHHRQDRQDRQASVPPHTQPSQLSGVTSPRRSASVQPPPLNMRTKPPSSHGPAAQAPSALYRSGPSAQPSAETHHHPSAVAQPIHGTQIRGGEKKKKKRRS